MLLSRMNNPISMEHPEKAIPVLVNGIMLLILAYLLTQLGYQILNFFRAVEETPRTFIADDAIKPVQKLNKHNIASMHLFGMAAIEQQMDAEKEKIIAPETKLNLTLRGIIAETLKQEGHAIIQNNDTSEEQFYAVKASVFGLATLEEIYHDRVILLHQGKYETLFLPKEALSREHFSDSAAIALERKAAATSFRKTFLRGDGDELNELFAIDTAFKSGGFIGFTVKALGEKGRQMMELFGVQDNDLITVINGMRLSESLEAFEEIKELKTATSFDIIIDRNGNEIPFHIELDSPPEAATASLGQPTSQVTSQVDSTVNPVSPERNNKTTTDITNEIDSIAADGDEEDDDLGEDWDESPEAIEYSEQQRARATGHKNEVLFDH